MHKSGDEAAFTELMLLLKGDLYKIAKARLRDYDDIYDVIQETMLIAFNSMNKLKNSKSFKSWIIRILINRSNSLYAKKNQKKVIPLEEIESHVNINYCNDDIENAETKLDFNFICKNLKYEDRIIIILYYIEKFTDKEIGEILKLKENTVKTKRSRAKQEIKNILKKGNQIYG